jgi:hypothetical protein
MKNMMKVTDKNAVELCLNLCWLSEVLTDAKSMIKIERSSSSTVFYPIVVYRI